METGIPKDYSNQAMLKGIEEKENYSSDIYKKITKGAIVIGVATVIALIPTITGEIYSAIKNFKLNDEDWKPVVVQEGQNLEGFLRGEGVFSDKPNIISRLFEKGFKEEMYKNIALQNPGETYSTSKIGTDWAIEVGDTLYLPDLNKDGEISWKKVKK